jgi:hypothetical protein
MNRLFHVNNNDQLSVMTHTTFDNEDILQELIERFPDIVDGEQFPGEEPRRWILVSGQMPVPDGDGSDRWALDHLLLDQDGIPTLIEVKRRKDGRSRREVIGQMFDYAANGPAYWPIEKLKSAFEKSCGEADASKRLDELLQGQQSPEQYWETVTQNLRSGRVRLIFLLDDAPPELLRIVQFLTRHLKSEVEIYVVEVRQHIGISGKILATRVLGTSFPESPAQAGAVLSTMSPSEWMTRLRSRVSEDAFAIALRFEAWMKQHGEVFTPPRTQNPSLALSVSEAGQLRYPFSMTPAGKANINICYLAYSDAYRETELLRQLVGEVAPTLGINPDKVNLGGVMGIKLDELAARPEKYDMLMRALDHIITRLIGTEPAHQ